MAGKVKNSKTSHKAQDFDLRIDLKKVATIFSHFQKPGPCFNNARFARYIPPPKYYDPCFPRMPNCCRRLSSNNNIGGIVAELYTQFATRKVPCEIATLDTIEIDLQRLAAL